MGCLLYTNNLSNASLAANAQIPFGSVIHRKGRAITLEGNEVIARGGCNDYATVSGVVKAGGRYAGLYTGGSAWLNNMYNAELFQYADWIAAWRATWPTYAGDIGMWQQGSMSYATGAIAYRWVSGYVDVDWCVVDYPTRIRSGEMGTPAAAPATKPASTATSDTKLSVAERSAQTAEHIAKHDVHGYSQPNCMG